jgi:Protein of unknown function (DUF2971)
MLCFSLSWHNPLLWSHYGEKHRGVALGFDLDEQTVREVHYVKQRLIVKKGSVLELADSLLHTKYIEWQYEEEVRVFANLHDKDPNTGLHFADFGDRLVLCEIILGPLCYITRNDLEDALGKYEGPVKYTKARLAFRSFQVVADQRGFKSIK